MKFMKMILMVALMCSPIFTDTGDWEAYDTLVHNQNGGVYDSKTNKLFTSYVNTDGIYVWYMDYPGYVTFASYDFEGDIMDEESVALNDDDYTEIDVDGNDEALFTVWTDMTYYSEKYHLLLKAKVSTDNGENWTNILSLEFHASVGLSYLRGLHANCDENGVHITTVGTMVFDELYGVRTIYAYLPNDASTNNDWVVDITSIPASSAPEWTANNASIEAINDFGSSNYDNIMVTYIPMIIDEQRLTGSISTDGGDTFSNEDVICSDEYFQGPPNPILVSMDLTEGGSYMDGEDEYRYFFAFWAHSGYGLLDTLYYSYRAAKGSPGYSGTWSTPTYFVNKYTMYNWGIPAGLMDANTNGSGTYGSVDLVYPYKESTGLEGVGSLKYRNVSISSWGTEETIDDAPRFFPDVTKNGNDIYVLYRTTFQGSTGDIRFKYRDATPIVPTLVKDWSGNRPKITWEKPCFDVEEYKVYRKVGGGSWILKTTTSNLYCIDNEYYYDQNPRGVTVRYKVKAVDYDNNESGYSNEISYIKMDEIGVMKSVGESLPTEYALQNAYPNPFNPTTTIRFDLPEETFVNITVFDINAKNVMTLVDSKIAAGRHTATLDGKNLSSGMYFVVMTTTKFGKMQKIILIK